MEDWTKGTPARIKDVPLSTVENRFAGIIDELVGGESLTQARITRLQVSPNIDGKVEMTILFELRIDVDKIFGDKKKEESV